MDDVHQDDIYERIGPKWREWCRGGMEKPFMIPKPEPGRNISMGDIAWHTATHFGYSRAELLTPGRKPEKSIARFLAMLLMRRFAPESSFPAIASYFRMDHTSILHGVARAEELLKTDPDFMADYNFIKGDL